MADHFAAFSFVDRVSDFTAGKHATGTFAIPSRVAAFPACRVAEAVGQLAAWGALSLIDFRGRPVAALATETRFHRAVGPGQTLTLDVDLDDCDDEVVAYSGNAHVDGQLVIELEHCLGPMLPVVEFDAPEALRARLDVLRTTGAAGGRFDGVQIPALEVTDHRASQSLSATLRVPQHAAFFADHFPRRPVFPATLLLDAQIGLANRLAADAIAGSSRVAVPSRMTNVKMRAFITPGQNVELTAQLAARNAGGDATVATYLLGARVDGKVVASAKVDIAVGKSVK
jgi:3-hydroxymyristoyl/3-hydroxydecanoyl-(acyl carrier protein) dehydratase